MSRFNTEMICPVCEDAERQHREYRKAVAVELAATLVGDFNFVGIGKPDETA